MNNSLIIRIEEIQQACGKILAAVDSNSLSVLTETLQIKTENKKMYISVTNREYLAKVKIDIPEDVEFLATVNANLFLKLVSQITTDTIELSVVDSTLILKGNGVYKLPLIFDGEKLLELPEIDIDNPTVEFDVDSNALLSLIQYNSKELTKGQPSHPMQKMYYVDEKGAITFIFGACVNSFTLEKPVKMLLNDRLVKLFKLFKGEKVHFTMGMDALTDDIIQTKVRFETPEVTITSILSCDDTMLKTFPVDSIRGRANATYPHSIKVNKDQFLQTINRLLLFSSANSAKDIIKPISEFKFEKDHVVVFDTRGENKEEVWYSNSTIEDSYDTYLDLNDLKVTLETCVDPYVTLEFGDTQAVVVTHGNIKNVIPECEH
mgnify:FL=1